MLFFLFYLLGCARLLEAQPVVTPPIAAPAPVGAPSYAPTPSTVAAPPVSPAGTPSNAAQQVALLALRAALEDPQDLLSNWSSSNGASFCSWRGVTCTNSSVTTLFLPGLSLSGTLSPAIANLSSLSVINLSYNKLSGLIPLALGSLHSLTSLHLGHNSFNGSIPSALFLSSSLQFLLLENNNLSGQVPTTIANLRNLRYLSLQSNAFSGSILSSIANLTKLSAIYAGSNEFNEIIPSQIGDLIRLIYLDLGDNLFTGSIPSSIGFLTQLKQLVLEDNQLEGPLPRELGNLHEAIEMKVSNNSFNGSIPPEIGSMSSLQVLDICDNNLEGNIPASLGNLTMLKSLNLSYNNLSGEIPTNGVLAKFNFTSFVGNRLLCGGPLLDLGCNRTGRQDPMMHRMPYDKGTSQLGKNGKVTIIVVAGAFGIVIIFVFLVFCSCRTRQEEPMERSVERVRNSFSMDVAESMRNSKLEIYMEGFTHNYEQIVSHAGYFDTAHVLGKGRFATVYKSDLPGGKHLAVKVFNNPSNQSTFEREVANLHVSASHVSTLLPIRGYYSNPIERAIFYDFMPKGTLCDVLRNSPTLLDWSKRIHIALGIAQALSHLHKGSTSKILHKDLKSSNVLLDDDFNPLVGDYGLIDLVSKVVVETPGYTPPEFTFLSYSVRRYTEKTDVYSFGIVLLELLTGKSPVSCEENILVSHDEEHNHVSQDELNSSTSHLEEKSSISPVEETSSMSYLEEKSHVLDQEEEYGTKVHLVTWVLGLHKEGQGLEAINPFVVESCPSLDHQVQAFNLAILCIDDEPTQRPSVSEIISILERLSSNSSLGEPIKKAPP